MSRMAQLLNKKAVVAEPAPVKVIQPEEEDMKVDQRERSPTKADYNAFKPSSRMNVIRDWISDFHEKYMRPAEEELTDLQKELFEVGWSNSRAKLGADIEGSITKSILETHKILQPNSADQTSVLDNLKKKDDAEQNNEEGKQKDKFEEF